MQYDLPAGKQKNNSDTMPLLLLTTTAKSSPWHHIPGKLNPHPHCCENHKSHIELIYTTSSQNLNAENHLKYLFTRTFKNFRKYEIPSLIPNN